METIELTTALQEIYADTEVNIASYTVLATDKILSVKYTDTGVVSIIIPSNFATENWAPITIKDIGGNAGTNNITISTEGLEVIDGAATAVINSNYSAIILYTNGINFFIT